MKVINFLTTKHPFPADDGQKIPVANIFTAATSHGHECEIFVPTSIPRKKGLITGVLEIVQRLNVFASFYDNSEICGEDISRMGKDSILIISPVRLLHHGRKLTQANSKIKIVLLLNDAKWPMYLEAFLYGIGARAGGSIGDLKKGIFLPIVFVRELFEYRNVDLVVVQTEREKKKIYGIKNVVVCTNSIEKPKHTWVGSASKTVCVQINLNSRRAEKWRPFISEVWPKIFKKFPEFTLELFGPGNMEKAPDWLKAVVGVKYVGLVDNLDEYLSRQRILLMPLEHSTGISNTVLRGLSMQMPLIISSTSSAGIESVGCNKDRCYVAQRSDDYPALFATVIANTYPQVPPVQIGSWDINLKKILGNIDEGI